jgi:hypothetical protein
MLPSDPRQMKLADPHQVAEQLDLLRYATREAPNPGPDPLRLKEAEGDLERIFGPPKTPDTALGLAPESNEPEALAA